MTDRDLGSPMLQEMQKAVREYTISDELAHSARVVIDTLDPETALASLVLWNEHARTMEKSTVRFSVNFAFRHKLPDAHKRAIEAKNSIESIERLPKAPDNWVAFLQSLDRNRRKALLDNTRAALMPHQGVAHDYGLKIGDSARHVAKKAKWTRRDVFVFIMYMDVAQKERQE